MPQLPSLLVRLQLSFTSLPSCLQRLRGRTNLIPSRLQKLPEKLDLTSFLTFGEEVHKHRRAFNPLEARFVTRKVLLDHTEFDSKTFVLRRFARSRSSTEKRICQLLAVIHAPGFCRLEIVQYRACAPLRLSQRQLSRNDYDLYYF